MTTQTDREVMQQAIAALENSVPLSVAAVFERDEAITALREALAQQPAQQEPLGYIATMALNDLQASIYGDVVVYGEDLEDTVAIYTAPQPQRQPLTDEQIMAIGKELGLKCKLGGNPNIDFDYARAIEAAHGITGEHMNENQNRCATEEDTAWRYNRYAERK